MKTLDPDAPIGYVLVRGVTEQELVDVEQAVQAAREKLEVTLRVFEVISKLHPTRLPLKEMAQVLWAYGHDGGMEPGRFITALLRAIIAADGENRMRLRLGFDTYVDLAMMVEYLPDAVSRLQALVGVSREQG